LIILVDSSVWIDYFRGQTTQETEMLDGLLGSDVLTTGDLILAEVLQGFGNDREFEQAKALLMTLELENLGGQKIAIQAARNYRNLRARGITIRKTIDSLIATWCIENGSQLLYSDRDFDPFCKYLGLKTIGEPKPMVQ